MGEVGPPRPLAEADDRDDFDCGEPSLNAWFSRHAWRNERTDSTRTYILPHFASGNVSGFVSLATGQVERSFLVKGAQRNRPNPVPVLILARLAIDARHQGRGYGADLLRHALMIALEVSTAVGFACVLTHPLTPASRQFYGRWGFKDLTTDPKGAQMLLIKDLRKTME